MRKRTARTRPHRRLIAGLAVLLVALPLITVPAHAEPSRAELDRAMSELNELESDLSAVVEEANHIKVHLEETQAKLEVAKEDFDKWSEEANSAQAELDARTADIYRSGLDSRLGAFFGSGSYSDFSDRVTYLSAISDESEQIATDATVSRQKADWAREAAEKMQAELEQQKIELEKKEQQIQDTIGKQEALVDKLEVEYAAAMDAWRAAQAAAAAEAAESERNGGGNGGGGDDPGASYNPPPSSSGAGAAVAAAQQWVNKGEYEWGASNPPEFDCSGFTMHVWRSGGVSLPHSSAAQFAATPRVGRSEIQPGDLVFFDTNKDGVINHVGIVSGSNSMIHIFSEGNPVRQEVIFGGWYESGYMGAGRPG